MTRIAMLVILLYGTTCRAAGNLHDGPHADLVYDYRTGFVTIDALDTPTNRIISFLFQDAEGGLLPVDQNYYPVFELACQCDSSNKQYGLTDLSLRGRRSPVPLGLIFPPGMRTPQELFDFLDMAKYAYDLGRGGDLDLVVVPEPTFGSLALLMLIAGARRLRRVM